MINIESCEFLCIYKAKVHLLCSCRPHTPKEWPGIYCSRMHKHIAKCTERVSKFIYKTSQSHGGEYVVRRQYAYIVNGEHEINLILTLSQLKWVSNRKGTCEPGHSFRGCGLETRLFSLLLMQFQIAFESM